MNLKHFKPAEFVDRETYRIHGDKSIQCIDRELLLFIDAFHDYLSDYYAGKVSITVNDWSWHGDFQWRGLRTPACYESSDKFIKSRSQHKFGKGLDFDVYVSKKLIPAKEIRSLIIKVMNLPFARCITFIEDGVNWVHVDTRPTPSDMLVLWNVKTQESLTYPRNI